VTIRSRLVLELASELVGMQAWPYRRAHLTLRQRDFASSGFSLFGSGSPDGIGMVARGEAQVAMVNPSAMLTLAVQGAGPFKEPIPLRAIAVIPDYDQLGFAVTARTGLRSLAEVRERRFPLRLSVRGPRKNSVPLVVNEVLKAVGFSLEEIVAWGGQVRYHRSLPDAPDRLGAVERGELDAIFDEAIVLWANRAADLGMRFLSLGEAHLRRLKAMGFRRGIIEKAQYPRLPADVVSLDFSGFPIYTHAGVPDELVRALCAALEARKDRIPWEGGAGPLPLERMCRDTVEGPLDVPLHPAAEAFWRGRGYLVWVS
jgi:TRAP-type uncharacterized transport system substrate-binding protein